MVVRVVKYNKRISPPPAGVFISFMLTGQDGSMIEMFEMKHLKGKHGN